jgi:trehalose-6-phosphate synthase
MHQEWSSVKGRFVHPAALPCAVDCDSLEHLTQTKMVAKKVTKTVAKLLQVSTIISHTGREA